MKYDNLEYDESVVRDGDVLVAVGDIKAEYVVHWNAPYTSGGDALIASGTRLVAEPPVRGATATYARAEDYEALEGELLPAATRSDPKYAGFSFVVSLEEIGHGFRIDERS